MESLALPALAGIQRVASATQRIHRCFRLNQPYLAPCRADARRWIPSRLRGKGNFLACFQKRPRFLMELQLEINEYLLNPR